MATEKGFGGIITLLEFVQYTKIRSGGMDVKRDIYFA